MCVLGRGGGKNTAVSLVNIQIQWSNYKGRNAHVATTLIFLIEGQPPLESPWKHETRPVFTRDDENNTIVFKGNMVIPFVANEGFLGLSTLNVPYLLV